MSRSAAARWTCIVVAILISVGHAQAMRYKVLYSFQGGHDGSEPAGPLFWDKAGNLYGTTQQGGGEGCNAQGCGTVFKVMHNQTEKVLYAFGRKTGAQKYADPEGGVIEGSSKNLFGTTQGAGLVCGYDGTNGCGTIFMIAPDGTKATLYRFHGQEDGAIPGAGLIQDSEGNIYGTAEIGGPNGRGTVYKLAPDRTFTVLHAFAGGSDGDGPDAPLLQDASGNLYGTTVEGGKGKNCGEYTDCGTIFEIAANGTESVLYIFQGGQDGMYPDSALMIDQAGNLYGTTQQGGAGCNSGCGTIFKLAPDGTKSVLYAFTGGRDGAFPVGNLVMDVAGNLYGTTVERGKGKSGTAYKLSPSGVLTVLHAFGGGADGSFPDNLTADGKGNMFGVTSSGGGGDCFGGVGCGTVFELKP